MALQNNEHDCTRFFHFKAALLHKQLLTPTYIGVNEEGVVCYISLESPHERRNIETVNGILLPGFQNAHSHAFQYGMAGMAEKHAPGTSDDFWSWREAMYQCALSMTPDDVQTVATALYIEMLKRGYTHVVEFHYLHHDKNGKPYENICEMSTSLIAAAALAGIKITLVPVYYRKGGFGRDAQPRQRRFIFQNVDQYFTLLEQANSVVQKITTARLGCGVHSLRAADVADIFEIEKNSPKNIPFHLHASEQLKEVEDSLAYLKQRPVEWLLNNLPLSDRFNIVHCTHLTDHEVEGLAKSKANVVLCPGTEGNLGDGIFRLSDFIRHDGNWCIGTDSHISLNPLEDLRWLDYTQRLVTHRRNTFNDGGATMLDKAYSCGQKAMGFSHENYFALGKPLDGVVYDATGGLLADVSPEYSLSRILYTGDTSLVAGTLINGRWVIQHGAHREEERISRLFTETVRSISIAS